MSYAPNKSGGPDCLEWIVIIGVGLFIGIVLLGSVGDQGGSLLALLGF